MTIIGGGIAGAWLAYRLAQKDVSTVLISAEDHEPAVSRQLSPALIFRGVLDSATLPAAELFADTSTTQDPAYPVMMAQHAAEEFGELSRLAEFVPLGEYLRPRTPEPGVRLGAGGSVVSAVLARFAELGGTIVQGRVSDIVMDGDRCVGVHYQDQGIRGKILCSELVFASGGFCGLFADGVGTNTGYLLGTFARHGGRLASLELFNRFALGLPDHKRPLYPFDFEGPLRLRRAGERAVLLEQALEEHREGRGDVAVFEGYWTRNLDVPHTVALTHGFAPLAPIRGFSMGGMAPSRSSDTMRNVHATGECAYGMALDSVAGKPFASFLAMGRVLADELVRRSAGVADTDFDVAVAQPAAGRRCRQAIRIRLGAFQDSRFSTAAAAGFVHWCATERKRCLEDGAAGSADVDLLILAEAWALSAMARTESRGFFFRPDLPGVDRSLDHQVTVASYDAANDEVQVSLSAAGNGASA